MLLMGIDPGLKNIGWGIIKVNHNRVKLVNYGCIETESSDSISVRLGHIYSEVCSLVKNHKPREVAVEELFFAKNTKSALSVAQARGAIMLALDHSSISVFEYTPLEIKQALVGYGRAAKEQVQFMVKQFLALKNIPKPDHASDALAAVLCHKNSRNMKNILT